MHGLLTDEEVAAVMHAGGAIDNLRDSHTISV